MFNMISLVCLFYLTFPLRDNIRITGVSLDFIYICAMINSTNSSVYFLVRVALINGMGSDCMIRPLLLTFNAGHTSEQNRFIGDSSISWSDQ